jgi:hypothetical protein
MIQENSSSRRTESIAKVILTLVFLGGFAFFTGWMLWVGPGLDMFRLSAMELTLLAFATYRLGRLIAYDRVMEPFRRFFTETVPDATGAGESVEPRGTGFQQAIGQLICCPICAGTWVAALLTYALVLFPGPARVFLTMSAAIGAAEVLGAFTEAMSWGGQYARTAAGAKMIEREQAGFQERGHPVELPARQPAQPVEPVEPRGEYREYRDVARR